MRVVRYLNECSNWAVFAESMLWLQVENVPDNEVEVLHEAATTLQQLCSANPTPKKGPAAREKKQTIPEWTDIRLNKVCI